MGRGRSFLRFMLAHTRSSGKEKPTPKTDDEIEHWWTLDATVLQWIYSAISNDLLNTILEPEATAMETWERLRDIFQDHQNSRVVILELLNRSLLTPVWNISLMPRLTVNNSRASPPLRPTE